MAHHAEPERYATAGTIERKAREWLGDVAGLNRGIRLRPDKSALIVIDMQRFFLEPADSAPVPVGDAILPRVKQVIRAFRQAGRPVVFTRHAHQNKKDTRMLGQWWGDFIRDRTRESELVPGMAPRKDEPILVKQRYSAFHNTGLEKLLQDSGVKDLVIAGVMTNLCCETTARDAFIRDFRVFFLADGTAAPTEAMHRASLLNLAYGFARITSAVEVERALSD